MVREFKYNGKTVAVRPEVMDCSKIASLLNPIQQAHNRGELNVYEPITAYSTRWETQYDKNGQYLSSRPVPSSSRRNDLPPVYMQWKDAAKK